MMTVDISKGWVYNVRMPFAHHWVTVWYPEPLAIKSILGWQFGHYYVWNSSNK